MQAQNSKNPTDFNDFILPESFDLDD